MRLAFRGTATASAKRARTSLCTRLDYEPTARSMERTAVSLLLAEKHGVVLQAPGDPA